MSKGYHLEIVFEAVEYIEINLTEPISVQDICNRAPLSSWQFQRLFRAVVGSSVGGYLRGRRLTRAAELLTNTNNRVLDIAMMMQYESQEAFTRAFKKQYTVTPGQIRENPNYQKLYKISRITKDKLSHIQDGIQREPIISRFGPINLVGIETTISSFLGERPDFESKLPKFWQEFHEIKKNNNIDMKIDNYGIAISMSETMLEENLRYFAGVPHANKVIPQGMISLFIEEKLYAIFENVGLADKSQATIDFIYGIWLPESGYKRAKGYDFEVFDQRYKINDPASISRYYLPIRRD